MRFLIFKQVDLVLQAHDHNYQRSKQLSCVTRDFYDSSCVSNNGKRGLYTKGQGTIFLISGTGGEGGSPINVADPDNGYFATYNSTTVGFTEYTVSQTSIQGKFVPVVGGTYTDSWSITNGAKDFLISPNPASLTVTPGSSGTATITLTSINRFKGTVALSATAPAGVSASLSPASVSLPSGGTASSALTVSSSTPGTYTVVVTAISGSFTHTTTVAVTVTPPPDFSISSSPSSLSFQAGSSGTSTISLASLNSFAGTVSLTSSVSPSGLTASITPGSVALSSGGSGSSTLTASSTTAGSYTITVNGTSGSLSHSTTVVVTVSPVANNLVASDSALGPTSMGTGGGAKLIQDSAGRTIAVYVDSSGRIGLAYANGDPTFGFSVPAKSATPVSAYARPAAVLVSLTSLRIIVVGGSASGVITDIPVTVPRDGW